MLAVISLLVPSDLRLDKIRGILDDKMFEIGLLVDDLGWRQCLLFLMQDVLLSSKS